MKTTRRLQNSLRKVAILIDSIDREIGDHLLSQMSLDKAAHVRQLIEELDDVDDAERDAIIDDFLEQTGWNREDVISDDEVTSMSDDRGVELQLSQSSQHHGAAGEVTSSLPNSDAMINTPSTNSPGRRPLGFVRDEHVPSLAELIQGESHQIGAVMLSLLEPRQAAAVLERFPPDLQAVLLRRLAQTGQANVDVVTEIVQMVQVWLSGSHPTTLTTGWHAVQQILNTAGWSHHQQLWEQVQPDAKSSNATPQVATVGAGQDHAGSGQASRASDQHNHARSDSAEPSQVVGPFKIFRGEAASESPFKRTMESEPSDSLELPEHLRNGEFTGASGVEIDIAGLHRETSAHERDDRRDRPATLQELDQVDIERRFDRLQELPAKTLVQVLKRVSPKVMMMAMTGAQPRLLAIVKKSLSRREAMRLNREIERSGPIRLADICKAQLEVLTQATELQESTALFESRSR